MTGMGTCIQIACLRASLNMLKSSRAVHHSRRYRTMINSVTTASKASGRA